jgi:hypothetical protein
MTQLLGPRNAITYAWFNVRGGLRSHAIMSLLVAVVLLGLIALTTSLGRLSNRQQILSFWAIALLVVQASTIVLVGGLGIANAIRQDAVTGMHDSMRLMRLSPAGVIMGYLTGASSQSINVLIPCVIAGAICSFFGGVGAGPWLWASALLLTTSAFMLVLSAFTGMMFKQSPMLILIGAIFGPIAIPLLSVAPGLLMLAGPAAGFGALKLRDTEVSPILSLAIVCQAGFGALFFFAAAHKFRFPLAPAFGVRGGQRLLAAWAIVSGIGLLFWETVRPRWFSDNELNSTQFVGTLIIALLISLVPTLNVCRLSGDWHRSLRLGHAAVRPRGTAAMLALTSLLIVAPAVLAFRTFEVGSTWIPLLACLLSAGAFTFGIGAIACRAYASIPKYARVVIGLLIAAVLILPLAADWVLLLFEFQYPDRPLSVFGQFSPIGTFVAAWWEARPAQPVRFDAPPLFPGLYAQMALAIILWLTVRPRALKGATIPAPATPTPAASV